MRWGGGERNPSGAIQWPFPIYSQAVNLLTRCLVDVGAVVVYDYVHWPAIDHTCLDTPATAARLATKLVRSQRFNESTIKFALENGSLLAVVDRLRRWYEQERPVR
ncbi:MAG: DUF6508 domain-containing protein [Actinomycetota bacterium]|nr:DUF6508 domain-containing protein [Actinomycetota bacterium]